MTYVSINIDPESILELADFIRANNVTVLGWAHSHADFGVFFSGVDARNQQTLLAETTNYLIRDDMKLKFAYGMTVNTHTHKYGVISTQYPCGSIRNVEAQFDVQGDLPANWDDRTVFNEIVAELKEKVILKKDFWGGWHQSHTSYPSYDDNFKMEGDSKKNTNKNAHGDPVHDKDSIHIQIERKPAEESPAKQSEEMMLTIPVDLAPIPSNRNTGKGDSEGINDFLAQLPSSSPEMKEILQQFMEFMNSRKMEKNASHPGMEMKTDLPTLDRDIDEKQPEPPPTEQSSNSQKTEPSPKEEVKPNGN